MLAEIEQPSIKGKSELLLSPSFIIMPFCFRFLFDNDLDESNCDFINSSVLGSLEWASKSTFRDEAMILGV